jgi:UrcA family protein
MIMNSSRVLPAFFVLAAGLIWAAQASGQTTTSPIVVHGPHVQDLEVKNEPIKVSDLDLKTEEGAETFIGRVRAASTRVCAPLPKKGRFKDAEAYEKCKATAMEEAVKASGSAHAMQVLQRTGD